MSGIIKSFFISLKNESEKLIIGLKMIMSSFCNAQHIEK